jgi:cytochrome b
MSYRFLLAIVAHNTLIEKVLKMNKIRVWDLFVRIFHWSLIVAFFIAYLSGEEENLLHIYSGYAVLGLVSVRLLWGIIGTKYARFSNFIYSPTAVFLYLKSIFERKPLYFVGHNPAAGWMVITLLLCLLVVTVSGLKVYAIEEGLGPLARSNSEFAIISNTYASKSHSDRHENEEHERNDGNYGEEHEENDEEEFWEEIHEVSANLMLLLIFLHIAGVLVSSFLHNENLIKAMITGVKVKED